MAARLGFAAEGAPAAPAARALLWYWWTAFRDARRGPGGKAAP